MDTDELKGKAKEGEGKVQEAWGNATDDQQAQAEGQKKETEGKVQQGWGQAKDKASDVTDN